MHLDVKSLVCYGFIEAREAILSGLQVSEMISLFYANSIVLLDESVQLLSVERVDKIVLPQQTLPPSRN